MTSLDSAALFDATDEARRVVATIPQDHPERAYGLLRLGHVLVRGYQVTADVSMLNEGTGILREAVAALPSSAPDRANHLSILALAVRLKAEVTGELELLGEAVAIARDAVALTPREDPRRPDRLSNLGGTIEALAGRVDDLSLMDEAVALFREAVEATPQGHPGRSAILSNLGSALRARFRYTGDSQQLLQAIEVLREALATGPEGEAGRSAILLNLAAAVQDMFVSTGDQSHLRMSAELIRAASVQEDAPARIRIDALRSLAELTYGSNVDASLEAVETAVRLLNLSLADNAGSADLAAQLRGYVGLPAYSAAVAVTAGRPERAVELLERTRGVLAARVLDIRDSDLGRLRDVAPDAAERMEGLRGELGEADHGYAESLQPVGPATAEARLRATRRTVAAAWERAVDDVQRLPGFAGFLRPPAFAEYADQAGDGPIVFVYTCPARSDALILTGSSGVEVLPLTTVNHRDALERVARFRAACRRAKGSGASPRERLAAEAEVLETLEWAWDAIAEPILTALGFNTTPTDSWPRVWWSPVGELAHLPLHAAGRHRGTGRDGDSRDICPPTVLDRVVSSYVTTIRLLAHARAQRLAPKAALIVSASGVPGMASLPGADAEGEALAQLVPRAQRLLHPTREAVLSALPHYSLVHFACHGQINQENPDASGLILGDSTATPLTIADINAIRPSGGLVFLSASETAVADPELPDEALHMSGAFLLAGYQHVIGTLWPITDSAARSLALDFYASLTQNGTAEPDVSRSAFALHDAVRRLRDCRRSTPTVWAAYTHSGA